MNMDKTGQPGCSEAPTDKTSDPKSGTESQRMHELRPFADQLMAIAEQLRAGEFADAVQKPIATAPDPAKEDVPSPPNADQPDHRTEYASLARRTYATRRLRERIFGHSELFGEPAWDILLDLYVAFVEQKPVSVSSACIGSAAPPTTGLRWLGVLADNDLIIREPDADDQRRVLVRLTDRGIEAMETYFASVSGSS